MLKRFSIYGSTLLFLLGLFSILSTFDAVAQTPMKQNLALGASSMGGMYYVLGGGMASIIQKAYPQINVNVEITGGAMNNLVLIGDKKLEIALVTNDLVYSASKGLGWFKGKQVTNARALTAGNLGLWQMVTLKRCGIKSIADLRGKRVSIGAAGSIGIPWSETVLNAYGLKMKRDWTPEYLGHGQGLDALKDGKVDAVLSAAAAPFAPFIDLTTTHTSKVVFLVPEKDKLEAILKENPYWFKSKIPANSYKGQDQDIITFGNTTVLIAEESLDAATAYAITKAILEHSKELGIVHSAGKEWTPENATRGIKGIIPFHPGAEKYLKEIGVL